ncbi:hypothetical protein Daus18300_011018 [Diaporthe australafricana]|uniref:Uncharacterized protein n=1 Tax=Diaporthe australafricana TaxID=127596 RepID=A0ABR3W885_9PEZI
MSTNTSSLTDGQDHQLSKAEKRRRTRRMQKRRGKKTRSASNAPIHLKKSRNTPQVADPAAPGDVHAHEYDDSRLLKKLIPDGQEHRGCESRDVDLRIKRDNKAVSTGTSQGLESEDSTYGEASK